MNFIHLVFYCSALTKSAFQQGLNAAQESYLQNGEWPQQLCFNIVNVLKALQSLENCCYETTSSHSVLIRRE